MVKIIAINRWAENWQKYASKTPFLKNGGKSFLEGEEKIFLHEFLKILNLATGILNLYCGFRNKGVQDYLESARKVKQMEGLQFSTHFGLLTIIC